MIKLKQTSLEQTGVALIEEEDGSFSQIPLYSSKPTQEAYSFGQRFNVRVRHVFYTNNIIGICKELQDYISKFHSLPRSIMEDLRCGFSHIYGSYGADYYPTLYFT